MCYKDRLFCSYYTECSKWKTCNRALTEEEEMKAKKLNLLVCMFDGKPECFTEIVSGSQDQ